MDYWCDEFIYLLISFIIVCPNNLNCDCACKTDSTYSKIIRRLKYNKKNISKKSKYYIKKKKKTLNLT